MKIGFAKMDITPTLPVTLGGYEHRHGQADSFHTRLYARCMAGESNGVRFALVSLDLLGVDQALREAVCRMAAERHNMSPHQISLMATHTHSAIDGLPDVLHKGLWTNDSAHVPNVYRQWLVSQIVRGIDQALETWREVTMQWSISTCKGVASNRRDASVETDSDVYLLKVNDLQTLETLGGLLHFNCHPTVMGPSENEISADYPGVVITSLERVDEGSVFLFANGAAGDISTRFTRQGSDANEAERMGEMLVCSLQTSLHIASSTSYVNLRHENIDLQDQRSGEMLHVYLQWIELGGIQLWLIPGEIFSSYAKLTKANHQLIVGYANGYIGYIPDEIAWERGGYEVDVCRLSRSDCQIFLRYAIESNPKA